MNAQVRGGGAAAGRDAAAGPRQKHRLRQQVQGVKHDAMFDIPHIRCCVKEYCNFRVR